MDHDTPANSAQHAIADGSGVPDRLAIAVPIGARVLVVSDLRLTTEGSAGQRAAVGELCQTIDAWSGPGVLVFNGNLVADASDVSAVLGAQPHLVRSLCDFAARPGRRVVVLPGDRDAALAWSEPVRRAIRDGMASDIALSVDLVMATGSGTRRVHVEPGHRLDPLAAFTDPRNPGESPIAQHFREQLVPSVLARGGGDGRRGWLSGVDRLADPGSFSRFVASRLAYRRLGRRAWLLAVPVAVAFALRLPAFALSHRRHLSQADARLGLIIGATVLEVVLLGVLAVVSVRSTWQALAGVSLSGDHRDPNDAPRAEARDLVTAGYAGLVTGHTCRAELANLGEGFYANTGSGADVVSEVGTHLPGLGLPSVFLAQRQIGWVELEAGHDLHVRLLCRRTDLPGASVLERLAARRGPGDVATDGLRVVATFPQGESWPQPDQGERAKRRVRRVATVFVAVAGFSSLVSALSAPWRGRLQDLRAVVPLAVPETAASLTALLAVFLLMLARGIRRGQRRAWLVCEVVLLVVAVLHLVKGVDYEESTVSLAVAAFLFLSRSAFTAAADTPRVRNGIGRVAVATVLVIIAGTLGLEFSGFISHHALRHHFHLSWGQALQATVERMVGVDHVRLPDTLDDFFSVAMPTATAALLLVLLGLIFRPVVSRHRRSDPAATDSAEDGLSRARSIMARHGSGTLDYFALRPDKQFFFWGDTLVAHAVYGGVCLVSPDPIGPVAEREAAWRAFRAYVDDRGWALGGLGAGEEWLPIYRSTGMHDLYVGDEAVIRVDRFQLSGGRFKGLRQAVNRVAKHGYTVSFHDPASLDAGLKDALEEVMTKSRRGDVERGFSMTLGRVFDPADRGLLLAVVHAPPGPSDPSGAAGIPVAFCQYVPAPGIGGYSLDLMRRDNGEHPNGLIDFAVVETIRYLAAHGNEGLGLNFATMRAVLAGEAGEGLGQRIQAWLLRRMGDSMQIESLWRFNAKFDPEWLPRYAIYDAPENALAMAIAVARAESFWELPVIGRFLVPSAGRAAGDPCDTVLTGPNSDTVLTGLASDAVSTCPVPEPAQVVSAEVGARP
jgi:lysylphosphatidylglycerol synthetase-like protein (DUF2156 family)